MASSTRRAGEAADASDASTIKADLDRRQVRTEAL